MKFVTAKTLRAAEAKAIALDRSLALSMMDWAGKGLARVVQDVAAQMGRRNAAVRLLAGPGNNGGDAFVAAMSLHEAGLLPEVWLVGPREKLRGSAKYYFDELQKSGVPWREMVGEKAWQQAAGLTLTPPIHVDALLGTGARGELLGDIRRAVEYLREKQTRSIIVAADVPTGMNPDTGEAGPSCVTADFTVSMCMPKIGLAAPEARAIAGSLSLVPVGLPGKFVEEMPDARPDLQLITPMDVQKALLRRERASHKGSYGAALLLGGSAKYAGAIVLATEGAIRSGTGLTRVVTVESSVHPILARVPEAIVEGSLSPDVVLPPASAILVGPGLTRDPEARRLVARLLLETSAPLVLDADAIAVLEGKPEVVKKCAQPVILTPHPGELAMLLGTDAATIQQDRLAAVRTAVERTGATVILKGAGTLVAQPDGPVWINLNGNPGMATGGTGDVLGGLLTGLLAQKIPPLEAACLAVWLHGVAGDIAAVRYTQTAMKASDIAAALPEAFRQITIR